MAPRTGIEVMSVLRGSPRYALGGALAAALALGVGELLASLLRSTSLVSAVARTVVDFTPGAIVHIAISTVGQRDKPALLLTVTGLALVIGALLGPVAQRRRRVGDAAFAGFALLGVGAAMRDPLASLLASTLVAAGAALAGSVALRALIRAADAVTAEPIQRPGRGIGSRRRFLVWAATAGGAAAVSAVVGRVVVGTAVDVEAQRQAFALPPADGPTGQSIGSLTAPGLSPIMTPNSRFYRIDTALTVPRVDAHAWRLRVTGMVEHPYELTFDELLALSTTQEVVTLACVSNEVGGDLVGTAAWQGTPLAALLERAVVKPGATQIVGRSVDGFTVGFPTAVALDGRASMVAVGMNGALLPAQHGYPARLVIPGLYGYVSATKWLAEIELTTLEAFDAYWITRGWDKQAPIKTQSRIDAPADGKTLAPGRVSIAGVAWAGIRGVQSVEVRIQPRNAGDVGGTWISARLGDALSSSSWRQWLLEWDAQPGEYLIEVRATDGRGDTQTAARQRPEPNGATGYHRITVRVRNA